MAKTATRVWKLLSILYSSNLVNSNWILLSRNHIIDVINVLKLLIDALRVVKALAEAQCKQSFTAFLFDDEYVIRCETPLTLCFE